MRKSEALLELIKASSSSSVFLEDICSVRLYHFLLLLHSRLCGFYSPTYNILFHAILHCVLLLSIQKSNLCTLALDAGLSQTLRTFFFLSSFFLQSPSLLTCILHYRQVNSMYSACSSLTLQLSCWGAFSKK